jgi:hypothetical protein
VAAPAFATAAVVAAWRNAASRARAEALHDANSATASACSEREGGAEISGALEENQQRRDVTERKSNNK